MATKQEEQQQGSTQLQFQTFTSSANVSFWSELCARKLDQFKLSEEPISIHGRYRLHLTTSQKTANLQFPSLFEIERNSFEASPKVERLCATSPGTLILTNTVEGFKNLDKKALFHRTADQIWQAINDGSALKSPWLLTRFLLLTFADIKKYKFYYWFAFPALAFPTNLQASAVQPLSSLFSSDQEKQLDKQMDEQNYPPFFLVKEEEGNNLRIESLDKWDSSIKIVGFLDPSSLPSNPGWPLRNFLVLIHKKFRVKQIQVLCYREHSVIFTVTFPESELGDTIPQSLGWETHKGKLQPKYLDLGSSMDPKRLAADSVDLNLKLMKWRLLPSLDLELVSNTKCLLLGSGTLGCNVARLLMGWGVRNITLVDNGNVSFSNPVRQTLFEFEDCLGGGKPKAEAAAARLKAIFPDMNAVGISLSIPMPGHAVAKEDEESARKSVKTLEDLVDNHDVVFVLMDSRESRWLPTVLCAAKKKILINIALGFDSYLVLRHGMYGSSLGCYFCNDVVAPQNSLRDRTLDQQCTVTRPGLSPIAAALGVELLVSVLQHPLKGDAPADTKDTAEMTSPLGYVPHSIRGFMAQLSQLMIVGHAYNKCTGCSKTVVEAYKAQGFDFLLKAFNHPTYLEDLTGLTQMKQEESKIEIELGEDDDFEI